MGTWFEGSVDIACSIDDVRVSLDDVGAHFTGVVAAMPGLTDVALVDQTADTVEIVTSEGRMQRANIRRTDDGDRTVVEYDETYDAGKVSATTHFRDEYTAAAGGVTFHPTVTDVRAKGVLGFFYRRFGSRSMGKAFLNSQKAFLERGDR